VNKEIIEKIKEIFDITYEKPSSEDEKKKKNEDAGGDYDTENVIDNTDTVSFQDHVEEVREKTKNFKKNVKSLKNFEKSDDALYESGREDIKINQPDEKENEKRDMAETETKDESVGIFGELDDSDLKSSQVVSLKDDTVQSVTATNVQFEKETNKEEEEKKIETLRKVSEVVDDINRDHIDRDSKVVAEEIIVKEDDKKIAAEEIIVKEDDKTGPKREFTIAKKKKISGKIIWLLEGPGGKWDRLYGQKNEVYDNLFFKSDEIDYDQMIKELREASADIKSVWSAQVTYEQMTRVNNWRDRIRQIQVDCNKQYFFLDRFLELLRGSVDMTQYEKPSSKQEGLYYLHLRDFEQYHSQLKAISKSGEIVSKTLDGAWETLSRQITVMLPQRNAENAIDRINKETSTPVESVENIEEIKDIKDIKDYKGFDTLDVSKKIEEEVDDHPRKTGIVGWGNVAKVRQKN